MSEKKYAVRGTRYAVTERRYGVRGAQSAGPARRIFSYVLRTAYFVLALGTSACTDWGGSDLDWAYDAVPWFSTMRQSVSFDPYEMPRLPAHGAVPFRTPQGDAPPLFTQLELDSAAATLNNPLPATPEVLARGRYTYSNQCVVCHGPAGTGGGPVVGPGKYPTVPSLTSGTAPGRSDGYIYAVIRVGRGLMPAYGWRMSEAERWATVHYVRSLQRAAPAPAGAPAIPAAPAAATGEEASR